MAADAHAVVIFTDDPGWHGRELVGGLARRGVDARFVSLTDCALRFDRAGHGIDIPGCEGALPPGVFVRGVPGGSLEAITLRLDVLHHLELLGCPVFNPARVIERTVDKAMTSLRLRHAGVATPVTFASQDHDRARIYAASAIADGRRLVKKPLFGSQGKGLRMVDRSQPLGALLPGEVVYLQDFVAPSDGAGFRDWRVMVIDGRAVAAMERRSDHWITNRARGADCAAAVLDDELAHIACAAALAVGADYAGVDLLRDAAGNWLVIEVNGIPAWQGLARATAVDVSAALCDAFCARLDAAPESRRAGGGEH